MSANVTSLKFKPRYRDFRNTCWGATSLTISRSTSSQIFCASLLYDVFHVSERSSTTLKVTYTQMLQTYTRYWPWGREWGRHSSLYQRGGHVLLQGDAIRSKECWGNNMINQRTQSFYFSKFSRNTWSPINFLNKSETRWLA